MTVAEGVAIGLGFLGIVAPDFWPKMPKSLSYTIAGIGLCWLTYSLILAVQDGSGMKLSYGPIAAIIVGAVFIAGGIFWHISRLHVGEDRLKERTTASQLDGTMKLECLQEAFQFPADGKLLELVASDDNARTLSFQNHWLSEYAYRTNPNVIPTRGGFIDKCRITNYGTAPVFNVKITAQAEFSEHTQLSTVMQEQRRVDSKTREILIPQVDPGPSGKVDFYMWNTPNIP